MTEKYNFISDLRMFMISKLFTYIVNNPDIWFQTQSGISSMFSLHNFVKNAY